MRNNTKSLRLYKLLMNGGLDSAGLAAELAKDGFTDALDNLLKYRAWDSKLLGNPTAREIIFDIPMALDQLANSDVALEMLRCNPDALGLVVNSSGLWNALSAKPKAKTALEQSAAVEQIICANLAVRTSPESGVSYTDGISAFTPLELSKMAQLISQNSSITSNTNSVYVSTRVNRAFGNYKVSVGDSINVSFGAEIHPMVIMGFNHYPLTTSSAYGQNTATGKAGILFQTATCLNTAYSNSGNATWPNCRLRTHCNGTVYNSLAQTWKDNIKAVNKVSITTTSNATLTTVSDKVFLPSMAEMAGKVIFSSYLNVLEGTQYRYYALGNSMIKKRSGTAVKWSLSSMSMEKTYHASYGYVFYVNTAGEVTCNTYFDADGVAPCFCL